MKQQHQLTARPRRIPSPSSALRPRGRCETPARTAGEIGWAAPTAGANRSPQPAELLPGLDLAPCPSPPLMAPLEPQLPPFPPDPAGKSRRRRGGAAVRSRRPARVPSGAGAAPHMTPWAGRGWRERRVPAPPVWGRAWDGLGMEFPRWVHENASSREGKRVVLVFQIQMTPCPGQVKASQTILSWYLSHCINPRAYPTLKFGS